jgi:hypothetical protein
MKARLPVTRVEILISEDFVHAEQCQSIISIIILSRMPVVVYKVDVFIYHPS